MSARPLHLSLLGLAAAIVIHSWIRETPSERFAAPAPAPRNAVSAQLRAPTGPVDEIHPPASGAAPLGAPSTTRDLDEQTLLAGRACLELAATDPLAALDKALSARLCERDPQLLTSLLCQWARNDSKAALDWTLTQAPGPWRNDVLSRLGCELAGRDPASAMQLVSTQLEPGQERDEALISVIHQWAKLDLVAAYNWVAQLPAGALQDRALDELAGLLPAESS